MTDDKKSISYTNRDARTIRSALINKVTDLTDDWTDFHESDLGVVLIELMSYLGDMLAFIQDRQALEAFIVHAEERKNVRAQLRGRGYKMQGFISSEVVCRFRTDHSKDVLIPKYLQVSTDEDPEGEKVSFATVESGLLDSATFIDLKCVQGEVINKTYDQDDVDDRGMINLVDDDIGENSITVEIDDDEWEKVDDAILHPEPGQFYSLEYDKEDSVYINLYPGWKNFVEDPDDVEIFISYMISLGSGGKVGSGTIKNVDSEVYDIDGEEVSGEMLVENLEGSAGGEDPESIEEAKKAGIDLMKTMWTAVTLEDYEILCRNFSGVANALALDWSFEEDYPELEETPYEVHLFIVTDDLDSEVPEVLGDSLLEYLNHRKVATTTLEIKDPTYYTVNISAELSILGGVSESSVIESVEERIEEFFDPKQRDFGETIRRLTLIREIEEAHEGIVEVSSLTPETNINVPFGEFPILGDLNITIQ